MTISDATVRPISADQFMDHPPERRLIVHDHARRFAEVRWGDGTAPGFAVSWRSDLIEISLEVGNQSDLWVGVDQRVACVSSDGRVVLAMGLPTPLMWLQRMSHCVALVCEADVLLINNEWSIRAIRQVLELVADISEEGDVVSVELVDGSRVVVG